jgi:hypothetical protein
MNLKGLLTGTVCVVGAGVTFYFFKSHQTRTETREDTQASAAPNPQPTSTHQSTLIEDEISKTISSEGQSEPPNPSALEQSHPDAPRSATEAAVKRRYPNVSLPDLRRHLASRAEPAMLFDQTAAWHARYDSVFETYRIPIQTREKALEIMLKSDRAFEEIVARAKHDGLSDAERTALVEANARDKIAQLQEVLGSEATSALARHGAAEAFRPPAQDFAAQCRAQGIPVSPATVETVAGLLAAPQFYGAMGGGASVEEKQKFLSNLENHAVEDAAKILSPEQLALFRQTLKKGYNPWGTTPRP